MSRRPSVLLLSQLAALAIIPSAASAPSAPEEIMRGPFNEINIRRARREGHCGGAVCVKDPSGACTCHCGRCKRAKGRP